MGWKSQHCEDASPPQIDLQIPHNLNQSLEFQNLTDAKIHMEMQMPQNSQDNFEKGQSQGVNTT